MHGQGLPVAAAAVVAARKVSDPVKCTENYSRLLDPFKTADKVLSKTVDGPLCSVVVSQEDGVDFPASSSYRA